MTKPKGFFKEGGKTKPRFEKKGITEDKLNVSVKGNNDTIVVGTSNASKPKQKLTTMQKDMLEKLRNKNTILTESDVNYIKNTVNHTFQGSGDKETEFEKEITKMINEHEDGYRITPEQTEKGLKYLKSSRIYNKFLGYREQDIVDNPDEYRLVGMYDAGTYMRSFHVPLYRLYRKKEGEGRRYMEYYVWSGEPHIIG